MQIIRIPTNQEYDILVDITCGDNAKMHWHDMFSWTNDEKGKYDLPSSRRVVRGYYSARGWNGYYATSQGMYVGFRPAVDILGTDALASDLKEGATTVMGTLYMNGEPVRVPQDPVCNGDVAEYRPGASLEMRESLDDPAYQVTGIRVGNAIIADRVLVNMFSYTKIEDAIANRHKHVGVEAAADSSNPKKVENSQTEAENDIQPKSVEDPAALSVDTPLGTIVVNAATDPEHPGVYIELHRSGIGCDMPLAMVEFSADDTDFSEGEQYIVTRVWSDASQEDYTDRLVHKGVEDYFHAEENLTRVWSSASQEDCTDRVVNEGAEDCLRAVGRVNDEDEYVVLSAPGIAVQMIADLNGKSSSEYFTIAQGRKHPENKVFVALINYNVNQAPENQCYGICVFDNVKHKEAMVFKSDSRSEESLIKLMEDILSDLGKTM